jgi:O-acetyl-ADP-ribose deacetylase (regulator of RNase III)
MLIWQTNSFAAKKGVKMGSYTHIKGNLLDSKAEVIGHCTNCRGAMGAGVALQIRRKWPVVFNRYHSIWEYYRTNHKESDQLGTTDLVETESGSNQYVANLYGQDDHDASLRQIDYEALYNSLAGLSKQMENKFKSVAFPFKMGCGLAGGEWTIVEAMIKFLFKNYDVEIWEFV